MPQILTSAARLILRNMVQRVTDSHSELGEPLVNPLKSLMKTNNRQNNSLPLGVTAVVQQNGYFDCFCLFFPGL